MTVRVSTTMNGPRWACCHRANDDERKMVLGQQFRINFRVGGLSELLEQLRGRRAEAVREEWTQ